MKETGASLAEHFGSLEDPRAEPLTDHKLLEIILIAIRAVICGAETWTDVELSGRQNVWSGWDSLWNWKTGYHPITPLGGYSLDWTQSTGRCGRRVEPSPRLSARRRLLAIYGWRENFIRYGYIYHMLQVEKFLYLAQATKAHTNKDQEEAAREIAKRIEGLVTLDVTEWRTEMQRVEEGSR